MRGQGGLLKERSGALVHASEEAEHLHDLDGVVDEEDDVSDDEELRTEFDVIAVQHGGKM